MSAPLHIHKRGLFGALTVTAVVVLAALLQLAGNRAIGKPCPDGRPG